MWACTRGGARFASLAPGYHLSPLWGSGVGSLRSDGEDEKRRAHWETVQGERRNLSRLSKSETHPPFTWRSLDIVVIRVDGELIAA